MNDERDSQLSAMFDNELPDTQCELLARRISRDGELQRQWASYALIGAALRREPVRARSLGAVVRDGRGRIAERVGTALAAGLARGAKLADSQPGGHRFVPPGAVTWKRTLTGAGIAATVAMVSVFWLRDQAVVNLTAHDVRVDAAGDATTIVLPGRASVSAVTNSGKAAGAAQAFVAANRASDAASSAAPGTPTDTPTDTPAGKRNGEPMSYTVPTTRSRSNAMASAQLANYVVAHSEFSGPLTRRNLLSTLVASDAVAFTPPATDVGAPAVATDAVDDGDASATAIAATKSRLAAPLKGPARIKGAASLTNGTRH